MRPIMSKSDLFERSRVPSRATANCSKENALNQEQVADARKTTRPSTSTSHLLERSRGHQLVNRRFCSQVHEFNSSCCLDGPFIRSRRFPGTNLIQVPSHFLHLFAKHFRLILFSPTTWNSPARSGLNLEVNVFFHSTETIRLSIH